MSDDPEINQENGIEEDVKSLMTEHDLDEDTAERAQELVDEGLDEDDAVELAEGGL